MRNKYRKNRERRAFFKVLKIAAFVFMACGAIETGIFAGNKASQVNMKLVENTDIDKFKTTLNNAMPIIDTIYNSGKISISLSSEIGGIVKSIFSFDLNKPITVLNTQSPIILSYYNTSYLPKVAMQENKSREDSNTTADRSAAANGQKNGQDNAAQQDVPNEAASSISSENEGEKENAGTDQPPENSIVSDGKIAIQNETKIKISQDYIQELINEPLKFTFDKSGPKALIYHTHTTESYLNNVNQLNKAVANRNEDPRYNVVRVGEELTQNLKKYKIDTIHNGTIHDEDFNVSYGKSLVTMTTILKSYPSVKMTFDIHRDAGGDDKKLRLIKTVNGKNVAQVMFVVGTNQNYPHPNWKENLKFAVKLQEKLNELCPGLARPIDLSYNRYNEHMTLGSLIIEVGGDGNTLDEALESTKYLAQAINAVVNK